MIRRLTKTGLLAAAASLLTATVVLAAYFAPIQVVTTTTAYDMLPVRIATDNSYLATHDFITATGRDVQVQSGGLNLPRLLTDDKTFFASALPAAGTSNFSYSTGQTPTDFDILVGYDGGYITVADDSDLEPGGDFAHNIGDCWIDTDYVVAKDLIYKPQAYCVYVSDDEELTARILDPLIWVNPTGNEDPDVAWDNEANAYDDVVGTAATTTAAVAINTWSSYINLTIASTDMEDIRFMADYNAAQINLVDVDVYRGTTWYDVYEGVFDDDTGGTVWNIETINGVVDDVTKVRFRFYNDDDVNPQTPSLFEVDFGQVGTNIVATATGVTSAEYDVKVTVGDDIVDDALLFDGTDATSYINCGNIGNGNKLWISLWFKLEADFGAGVANDMYVFGKRTGGPEQLFLKLENADGKLYWHHTTGGVLQFQILTVETFWAADKWYHVIASLSNAAGARLRINSGTAVTNANLTPLNNAGNFVIGAFSTAWATGYTGFIVDVVTGNDDLTPEEELGLYNGIAPGDETEYWYVDEGAGNDIFSYGSVGTTGAKGAGADWSTTTRPLTLAIYLDNVLVGSGKGAGVPNNSEDWLINYHNALPYMEYLVFYVF